MPDQPDFNAPAGPPTDQPPLEVHRPSYREITFAAVAFGVIVGIIMNAAITYAGLKIGFTLTGSAIAAVLGFGVLRGILRRGSILETNIGQTIASSVNTSNSGIIFTVPVLLLMGIPLDWSSANFWLITLAGCAGAVLGTAFIIPLRKQMIDIDRLRFPSGTGVAVILKSPGAGPAKAIVLMVGIVIGALIYLPAGLPQIKLPAPVDELETLFERGRISWPDVERTRRIAGWIEQESAPAEALAWGATLTQIDDRREAVQKAGDRPADDPELARLQAQAAEQALPEIPADLARAAYDASRGEAAWRDLRATGLGWAAKPLWSYADLEIRLPAREKAGDPPPAPVDQDGDGVAEPVLERYVDQNRDGRPDLLVTESTVDVGRALRIPAQFQIIFAIAPFALGAGFITGRPGLMVLAGGILAYFVLGPTAYAMGWLPSVRAPDQAPGAAFVAFNRPLGIGLLLGGALMGVVASLPAIREALKGVMAASKIRGGTGAEELGLKPLAVAVVLAGILLFIAAAMISKSPVNTHDPLSGEKLEQEVATAAVGGYTVGFESAGSRATWQADWDSWNEQERKTWLNDQGLRPGLLSGLGVYPRAAIIAIVGCLWIWFAGIIIAQCAGMTDWSPVSGLALVTIVLILLLAGTGAVIGAVMIGAALCVAITLASDMMQDLKSGHLIGGIPRRQQLAEMSTAWIGPIVAMLVVVIIAAANVKAGGPAMGPGAPNGAVAPQAQALQAVIGSVQGGEAPYMLYGVGALLGALLGLGAFSGLGVLIGLSMYLPFQYIATYGIGCIVQMVVSKWKGRQWSEDWGVPMAAGLVVGESILALIINLIVLSMG